MAGKPYKPPQPGELDMTIRFEDPATGKIRHTSKDFSLREGWTPFGEHGFWMESRGGVDRLRDPTGMAYKMDTYKEHFSTLGPQPAFKSGTRDTSSIANRWAGSVDSFTTGLSGRAANPRQEPRAPFSQSWVGNTGPSLMGPRPFAAHRISSGELSQKKFKTIKSLGGYNDTVPHVGDVANDFRYINLADKRAAAASVASHTGGLYDDVGLESRIKRIAKGQAGDISSLQKENPRMLSQIGSTSFAFADDKIINPHYRGVDFSSGGQHISGAKVERRLRSLYGSDATLPTGGSVVSSSTGFIPSVNKTPTGFRVTPLAEANPTSFKALDVNMSAMERLHSEGIPAKGWRDNSFLHPDTMTKNLKSGVDWKDSPLRGLRETVEKINKVLKETFLSKPPSNSAIAQMTRVAGGGTGGLGEGIVGGSGGSVRGGSSGGFGGQFAQQLRHAAAWQMYMPVIGAVAGYAGAAVSPFSSKAAMELQGLGATPQEMRLARNMGYNISEDPYRHPQQNIQVDKRVMSAYGMAPTVKGQLEARQLGQYLPLVQKATEMEAEPAVQIMSRLRRGMPDRTKTDMEQSIQIASGMTKAGQLTDVMGNEMVQGLNYGMSAFSQMFPGNNGAAEALAFITPLIQRGLPGVGRASQHLTNPNALEKIAHSQIMSEMNSQNMAANGGNLAYALNETQFKKMLKGKNAQGQDLRNRVQLELQSITSNTTAEQWTKRVARYGGERDWHLRHGIDSPTVDANLDRLAMGAYTMLSTEAGRQEYFGLTGEIKGGYGSSSIKKDKDAARPIDDTPSNYAIIKREAENMAINNPVIDDAMRKGANLLVETGLETKLKQHLNGNYTPAERKALVDATYENYKYAIDSGQMQAPEGGVTVKQQYAQSIDVQDARLKAEKETLRLSTERRKSLKKIPGIGPALGWWADTMVRGSVGITRLPGVDYLTDEVFKLGMYDKKTSAALGYQNEAEAYDPNNIGQTSSTHNIPGDINWTAKERRFKEQGLFPGVKPEGISEKDVKDPLSMVKVKDGYLQVTIEPGQIQKILEGNKGYSIASSASTDGPAYDYILKPSPEKKSPADSTIAPAPEPYSRQWGIAGRAARHSNYYGSGYYTEGE